MNGIKTRLYLMVPPEVATCPQCGAMAVIYPEIGEGGKMTRIASYKLICGHTGPPEITAVISNYYHCRIDVAIAHREECERQRRQRRERKKEGKD